MNPIFDIDDGSFVMATQYMAAILVNDLGKPVGSLSSQHQVIVSAIGVLLTGV